MVWRHDKQLTTRQNLALIRLTVFEKLLFMEENDERLKGPRHNFSSAGTVEQS